VDGPLLRVPGTTHRRVNEVAPISGKDWSPATGLFPDRYIPRRVAFWKSTGEEVASLSLFRVRTFPGKYPKSSGPRPLERPRARWLRSGVGFAGVGSVVQTVVVVMAMVVDIVMAATEGHQADQREHREE